MSLFSLNKISEILAELKDILVARKNEPELKITSLPRLNKKIWGIHKKRLTVIGARTSHGKTSFVLQIAYDIAKQGKEVLFLSLEMTKLEMMERLFCNRCRVDNYQLLTGHFDNYQSQFINFTKEIENVPLVFSDCIGKNWQEIDQLLSELKTKPQVIILDYLQAIKGLGEIQKEKFDDYINNFRNLAIKHNFAAILCSQINRTNPADKNPVPQLHQLKGTGVLEEAADIAILLYYVFKTTSKEEDKYKYKIFVDKNRNGRTGFFDIKYYPEHYLFDDTEETDNELIEQTVDYRNQMPEFED